MGYHGWNFSDQFGSKFEFSLSELNPTASIRTDVYAVDDMQNYDMIIGRDLLNQLGFVINFNFRENPPFSI